MDMHGGFWMAGTQRKSAARVLAFFSGLAITMLSQGSVGAKDLNSAWSGDQPAAGGPVLSGELNATYSRVMRNPGDTELNLRFARLAEASGYARWALATYERVLLNDPGNAEAEAGYLRLRRAFQPNITSVTFQMGAGYESNPTYYIPPARGEFQSYAGVSFRDERTLGDMRWRTTGTALGQLHEKEQELNYGYAGIATGPVFDLFPDWRIHPAIGAAAAYFDNHFYYGEGSLGVTIEKSTPNVYRSLLVRGAYRSYDQFFPTSEGFYVEARGRLGVSDALGPKTAFVLSPWVLWSDLRGSGDFPLISDVQPGAYVEFGARAELYWTVASWLVLGSNITAFKRTYRTEIDPVNLGKRVDDVIIPGASATFTNLISRQTDLRFDYKYISDTSTDSTKSFIDHVIQASVIHRFDPIVSAPANLH